MNSFWLLLAIFVCASWQKDIDPSVLDELDFSDIHQLLHPREGELLKPIMRPRVSGTVAANETLDFMRNTLESLKENWQLEVDRFTERTPIGDVQFANLVATLDPPDTSDRGSHRLVLSSHYESSRIPEGFIGATDSAVPVAIMLYIARKFGPALMQHWMSVDRTEREHLGGLQLIFFDGEEAMRVWSDADSIYGSKHLAQKWESEYSLSPAGLTRSSKLGAIDLFVLLDLLGAPDPKVPSYYHTTHWAYVKLAQLAETLSSASKFHGKQTTEWFVDGKKSNPTRGIHIDDDHKPWITRGVEILHLIPVPFPSVWHTIRV